MTLLDAFEILLFWGIWLLVGFGLTHAQIRAEWDPRFRLPQGLRRPIAVVSFLRRWIGIVVVSGFLGAGAIAVFSAGSSREFVAAVLYILLPFSAIEWFLTGQAAALERLLAGDHNPEHRKLAVALARVRTFTPMLKLIMVGLGVMFGGFLGLVAAGTVAWSIHPGESYRRRMFGGKAAHLIDFPDLPLRQEIEFLLKKSISADVVLVASPGSRNHDPFRSPVMQMEKPRRAHWKWHLAVPVAVLQAVDPPVYTALLSRELAFSRVTGSEENRVTSAPISLGCLAVPLLVLSVLISWLIVPHITSRTDVAGLAAAALFLVGFAGLWWWLEIPQLGRECHRDAYLSWHDADRDAERSVEEFVAALARGDAVLECIRSPEVAMHRLQRQDGLISFLDLCGPELKESALEAARAELTEQCTVTGDG